MIKNNNIPLVEGGKNDEFNSPKSEIADLIFPNIVKSVDDILELYPARNLPEGSIVTRIAPSPTGFMHIGTLYVALISERLAHQNEGVFYLRIEDTDKNREVDGAIELIVKSLHKYGINVDEGEIEIGEEQGLFGPYKQSKRAELYKIFIKELIKNGNAYPCFSTVTELDNIRATQEKLKVNPGYYGHWAKWRNRDDEEVISELKKGTPYVIRFRSKGNHQANKVKFFDLVKGEVVLPENDKDIVIMKQDGLPTYHFAHSIDDSLMGTTHVIRGDEWLSSTPLHIELFKSLGFSVPNYAHISPIQKLDGNSKVKLSKRKHPEASMIYYEEEGYPQQAVIEYLLNLVDSNFEEWRDKNQSLDNTEFKLSTSKMGSSGGALLDFTKLENMSKNIISLYSPLNIYTQVLEWSSVYNKKLHQYFVNEKEYILSILSIERGENADRIRKDIAKWNDIEGEILFFFDDELELDASVVSQILVEVDGKSLEKAVGQLLDIYNSEDDKEVWFTKIRDICEENNFAMNGRKYKKTPEQFNGSIVNFTNFIRFLLSGKTQTKDLYQIMKVMGNERVKSRLSKGKSLIK